MKENGMKNGNDYLKTCSLYINVITNVLQNCLPIKYISNNMKTEFVLN